MTRKTELEMGEISSMMQERRLNWYGHVTRREDNYVGKRVLAMEVPGPIPDQPGQRKRGRPNIRWKDKIKEDMIKKNLR